MRELNFLGVCSWLSAKYGLDLVGLRWVFVITTILGVGSPILIYLILALVKPKYS